MSQKIKSQEAIQAQVAIYADSDEVHNEREFTGRNRTILENIGAVTADYSPDIVTYPRPTAKKEFRDGELVTIKPTGYPELLFDEQEYKDILRSTDRAQIHKLADMIDEYKQFAKIIEELGITGLSLEEARSHPNFLSNGGSNMAFRFERTTDEGTQEYVALFAQYPNAPHIRTNVNKRAINLTLADGLPGFEQGVAVSYDPPVVISELAPGQELYKMSFEERLAIPEEHWKLLFESIVAASERGIIIDHNSDNFLYDPVKGFTVIDFRRKFDKDTPEDVLRLNLYGLRGFWYKVVTTENLKSN